MRLSDIGEFGLIARFAALAKCDDEAVIRGLGDDCAILQPPAGELLVVTTDAMLEGRHFRRDWLAPAEIGRRAMTAGLSDVAAMGAQPRFAFSSLAIPPSWTVAEAVDLARGLAQQAAAYGACLVGGDTVAAFDRACIDVIVIGSAGGRVWRRDGAHPGEVLCVTGCLGGCAAAVAARAAGLGDIPCWRRYSSPVPRVREALRLQQVSAISAALDVSDGLVQDAGHICEQSGVGLRIRAGEVPVDQEAVAVAEVVGASAREWALAGGEDFELLFTAPASAVADLQAAAAPLPVAVIGEVIAGNSVTVLDETGQPRSLPHGGWDHFSADPT